MVIHLTEQGVSRTLFAAAVLLFAAAQGMLWHSGLRFNGDEPHILLTSLSIIKHFDLNMYPSFREHDFTALGFSNLDWQVPPVNGFIPPEKGIGFPVLITPLYAAFGLAGTRLALIGLNAAVTFVLLFYNCTKIGLSVPCAGLACRGRIARCARR